MQIIPAAQRRPSVGQRLSNAVGTGLQAGNQLVQQHQQKQKEEQENQYIKDNFGIDLTGISNPETRKAIFTEQLKGKSKENLLNQKTQKFGEILGGGQQNPQPTGQQLIGNPQEMMQDGQELSQNMGQQSPQGQRKFTDDQILQATNLDPNLGREMRMANDEIAREERHRQDLDFKKMKESPEHRRETQIENSQAQADVKYNQTLQESSKQHELKQQTLDRLETLNKKGVTGKPYEKLLEKSGLINLTSEGRREFAADVKNLITDIRSILGGQFSNFEFQTILNAYPSADFSKEANAVIIKNLKNFQDIKKKEVEFAQQLKKDNKGKIPFDFQAIVNEKVREYAATKLPEIKMNTQKIMNEEYGIKPGFTLMFDPEGNPLNVPESDVEKYESLGALLP